MTKRLQELQKEAREKFLGIDWPTTETDIENLITHVYQTAIEDAKGATSAGFTMNVDEYLPRVKAWNGTNYDVPFGDGWKAHEQQTITALQALTKDV